MVKIVCFLFCDFYHNLKIKWSSRLFSGGESLAHELERQQSWDELEWGLAWSELG